MEQLVTLDIKDTQFVDDRFFLLFHPDSLASQRLEYLNLGTRLANEESDSTPGTLNVWLDDGNVTNNRENASKSGVARIDPTNPDILPEQSHQGFFDLLIEGTDYVVTDQIIVELSASAGRHGSPRRVLRNAGRDAGRSEQGASELELKLIKSTNPDTLDFTWDYTLRNVYSLREPDIEIGSLDLTIYRGNQDLKQTFESIDGESRKYVEILGVSDENSRVSVPRLLRDPFGGADYLVLPSVRPFFQPVDENGAVIPLERPNRQLYFNSDGSRTALDDQVYFIEATYLSQGGLTGRSSSAPRTSSKAPRRSRWVARPCPRDRLSDLLRLRKGRVLRPRRSRRSSPQPVDRHLVRGRRCSTSRRPVVGCVRHVDARGQCRVNSTLDAEPGEPRQPAHSGDGATRTLIGTVEELVPRGSLRAAGWMHCRESRPTSPRAYRSRRARLEPAQPNSGEVFLNDFENIDVAKRDTFFA